MKFIEVKLIVIVVVAASLVQLVLTNNLVAAGAKVAKLESERSALAADIESLNNQISGNTSLDKVAAKAATLGLISSPASFDFISSSLVAARVDATP